MKRLPRLFVILMLLPLVVSCAQQLSNTSKQQEARAGLDALVAQLPELENFNVTENLYFETSFTAYKKTCYYATGYVIIGSSLLEVNALDVYTEKLELLGWTPREKQHEIERVFYAEANGRVVVSSGEPDESIKHAVNYQQLKENYRSVIFVRLVYMLPSRDEC